MLVSTFGGPAGPREVRVTGLPWAETVDIEARLVDGDHDLDQILPRVERSDPTGFNVTCDMAADAVLLLRFAEKVE